MLHKKAAPKRIFGPINTTINTRINLDNYSIIKNQIK